jgi:hypothetical protein
MLATSSLGLNVPIWDTLAMSLIGGLFTGLTLLLGLIMAGRWRRKSAAPRVKEETTTRDPFVYGSATEKRIALRRRGNPVKVLISDADAVALPQEGWILDRSVGGLCLQVEKGAVPVGTVLSVRSCSAPKCTPWTQVEVRSCRQEGSAWELGCQFVKTPSWNVLLLFG